MVIGQPPSEVDMTLRQIRGSSVLFISSEQLQRIAAN